MAPRCLFCGRRPVEHHHVSGRPAAREPYLDPALTIALCRRHHAREHELLRRLGLDALAPGADALEHRLVRLLDLLGRCADHGRPFVLEPRTPYGSPAAGLRDLLLEAVGALAERRGVAA